MTKSQEAETIYIKSNVGSTENDIEHSQNEPSPATGRFYFIFLATFLKKESESCEVTSLSVCPPNTF